MRTLLVAIPGLVLAGIGLTHPHYLDASTARWVLLDDTPKYVRYPARAAAFGYAVFYGALDALAGIGGGAMTLANGGRSPADEPLFRIGNQLGHVGAWCFFAASLAIAVCALLKHRLKAIPGAVFLALGSFLFLDSHIYWPKGVLACTCIALGMAATSYASAPGRSEIAGSTRT